MAGAGYKLFNTGDVLTAAQVNTYLQEQAVMRFANATARTTALSGVLAEGMMSYLDDTNSVEVYNGSAWVSVGSTGDITGVTAGTGISGGGISGDVTITNSMATAIDAKGDLIVGTGADTFSRLAVGTNGHTLVADSGAGGGSVGLKWAVDPVADIVTTAGDILYATAADTLTRLGIGTAGQVLKVNSGATAPEWAAATGGKDDWVLLNTGGTTLTGAATITVSGISNKNKIFILVDSAKAGATAGIGVRINGDTGNNYNVYGAKWISGTNNTYRTDEPNFSRIILGQQDNSTGAVGVSGYCRITGSDSSGVKMYEAVGGSNSSSGSAETEVGGGFWNSSASVTSVSIFSNNGNFTAGTVFVYTSN